MGLIVTDRHSRQDLARWDRLCMEARLVAMTQRFARRLDEASRALAEFGSDDAYVGVSWGKDSVVVAALADPAIPRVWIRVEPVANPECEVVRDAWRERFAHVPYLEVTEWCTRDHDGWHATGTLERGFARVGLRRHVSGVRADESGIRTLTTRRNGLVSATTCRPLGWWTGLDVLAYLVTRDLPIHPAYAYTMDGLLDPARLRVASLGGRRGDGMGRREWERRYYRERLSEIERIGGA